MPLQLQLRRGTSTQNDAFTGAVGEITVDTTNRTIRVHDNSTVGGSALVNISANQTLTNKTLTSPVIGGHATIEGQALTGATGTGNLVLSAAPTITGHPTIEGVTSTGATGTGKLVFDNAPTITGHATIEGQTLTGATGTGNLVLSAAPALTGNATAVNLSISGNLTLGTVDIKSLSVAMAVALS